MPLDHLALRLGVEADFRLPAPANGGGTLTHVEGRTNGQADLLAKQALEELRVPAEPRAQLAAGQRAAHQLAKWVGQATALA